MISPPNPQPPLSGNKLKSFELSIPALILRSLVLFFLIWILTLLSIEMSLLSGLRERADRLKTPLAIPSFGQTTLQFYKDLFWEQNHLPAVCYSTSMSPRMDQECISMKAKIRERQGVASAPFAFGFLSALIYLALAYLFQRLVNRKLSRQSPSVSKQKTWKPRLALGSLLFGLPAYPYDPSGNKARISLHFSRSSREPKAGDSLRICKVWGLNIAQLEISEAWVVKG